MKKKILDDKTVDKDLAVKDVNQGPTGTHQHLSGLNITDDSHKTKIDDYNKRLSKKNDSFSKTTHVAKINEANIFRVKLALSIDRANVAEFMVMSGNDTISDQLMATIKRTYKTLQERLLQPKEVDFDDCVVLNIEFIDVAFGFTKSVENPVATFIIGENGIDCHNPNRAAKLAGLEVDASVKPSYVPMDKPRSNDDGEAKKFMNQFDKEKASNS